MVFSDDFLQLSEVQEKKFLNSPKLSYGFNGMIPIAVQQGCSQPNLSGGK